MTQQKILVTGSNGFVGRYMVRELLSRGFQVVCLVQHGTSTAVLDGLDVELRWGDMRDKDSVIKAVAATQSVIHLAAAVGDPDPKANSDVNVGGAHHLVEACKTNGVPRIIGYSSVSATRSQVGAYAQSKKESEPIFLSSGADATIIRPEMIYGNGSKGLQKIIRQVEAYPFFIPMVGRGSIWRQPIYVRDIVKLTVDIIDNPLSFNKAYDVGGITRATMRDFVRMIAKELGTRKRFFPVPKPIALGIAYSLEKLLKNPPFTLDNMLGLTVSSDFDTTPATQDLHFESIPLEIGVKKAIHELKENIF